MAVAFLKVAQLLADTTDNGLHSRHQKLTAAQLVNHQNWKPLHLFSATTGSSGSYNWQRQPQLEAAQQVAAATGVAATCRIC